MKELTNQEKIELVEEAYELLKGDFKYNTYTTPGIRLAITTLASNRGFITRNDFWCEDYPVLQLIPELLRIKPKDKSVDDLWFGPLCIENVPARLKALEKLLEILKSSKVKELSTPDKIRLLKETLKHPNCNGICYRTIKMAYDLGYITREELWGARFLDTARRLIPELMRLKPVGKGDGHWFGDPIKENIPARQTKLKELIEIIKSRP